MGGLKTLLSGRMGPAVVIALSIALGASVTINLTSHSPVQAVEQKSITPQQHAALSEMQDAFTALVADVQPCVVGIEATKTITAGSQGPQGMAPGDDFFKDFPFPFQTPNQGPDSEQKQPQETVKGYGSGVIIRSDGVILTNEHVVHGADKVRVKLKNGRWLDGKVTADAKSDLAIVRVNAKDLPAAKLGDSDKIKAGSWAIAIGSPFELDQSVTIGVVSGTGRQEAASGDDGETKFYSSLIQTDASINPGNSGGPLVNIDGEVVGINTLIRSSMGGGSIGIGFAIPVNRVKFITDKLLSSGRVNRGFLGIMPEDMTPEMGDHYGVSEGAFVRSMNSDSPAEKGGIEVADVIVEFNGKKIADQNALRQAIEDAAPGTKVQIVVVRAKARKTLTVEVGEQEAMQTASTQTATTKLGFTVAAVSSTTAERYGLPDGAKGVVVTKVNPGSSAADRGVTPGMLIIAANDEGIQSLDDFSKATKSLKSGDVLWLTVKYKKQKITIDVAID